MSLLGFDIGVRALLTSQARLETIGHNLANATTPGYSRQSLLVSAAMPQYAGALLVGGGVQADAIQRVVDEVLQGRMTQQASALGFFDLRVEVLEQVEAALGGLSDVGPAKMLEKMFASFGALSAASDDGALRTSAVQSAVGLASRLNQLAGDVDQLRRTVASRLDADVGRVNVLAQRISALNRQIVQSEGGTATANDLRDQRDLALRELAQLADVRAVEDERGGVRVLIGGRMLVSPTTLETLRVDRSAADGSSSLAIDGAVVEPSGGEIGGLIALLQSDVPQLASNIDAFTRTLIYESNRVHSTGVALDGPFSTLRASNALSDQDGDGAVDDELLADAGLPFAIESGELVVNVTDRATGAVTTHALTIDAERTTVGDFMAALEALPHMSARLDARGQLELQADSGFGFDFGVHLEAQPDQIGSFGGLRASLGSASSEPFALAVGDTLDFSGPFGAFTVSFQAGAFANIGAATAEEVAAALAADAGFAASGLTASAVGGSLVVQTSGTGSGQTFTVAGGSAIGAFGWGAGQVVVGSDVDAAPRISGSYTGAQNGALVFRPNMDGAIGTTSGLLVEVFDQAGNKLADLQVGAGYQPGDELEVVDGVKVAFGYGLLSATDHDVFQVDVVADSDSARVLPALGLNGLFGGVDAATIAVRSDIATDPAKLAASLSGAPGDAGNLLRLIELEAREQADLGGASLGERLAQLAGGVGFELQSAGAARQAEQLALDSLEARRSQVSGVNSDEELVHMLEQQQAYNAAAQFLRVVNEITGELLDLL